MEKRTKYHAAFQPSKDKKGQEFTSPRMVSLPNARTINPWLMQEFMGYA